MQKRITLLLDDDLYHALLERAGSERKISETLNPMLRLGLAQLSSWHELREGYWRKEGQIPVGRVVAEVHRNWQLDGYAARVELVYTDPRLAGQPGDVSSRTLVSTLEEAQAECDRAIADIAAKYRAWLEQAGPPPA